MTKNSHITDVKLRIVNFIAQRLRKADCKHASGTPISGGEVLTLIDALELAGIKGNLVKHENSTGFMAEGVHHINKESGVLVSHSR